MKKLLLFFVLVISSVAAIAAAEPITLTWDIMGVASTQSNVVLTDCPVVTGDGSAGGSWVLNSQGNSYARSYTQYIQEGIPTRRTLQLGSANTSAVGTSVSLSSDGNPIPANATINSVSLLVKSLLTTSQWSVSVDGVKSSQIKTSPSAAAMDYCTELNFDNLNMTGRNVALTFEDMETAGRYVYIAQIRVTYTSDAEYEEVAAPLFNPESGAVVESGSTVTVTSATAGAKVYYAVGDGAFTLSDGPVVVSGSPGQSIIIRAYATKEGMTDSRITTATYTICRQAVEPPFAETFGGRSSLDSFTIIDAGADNSTWKYNSADEAAYVEHQIGNGAKNDWLITPALSLKGGSSYRLRMDVRAGSASYPEVLEVAYGSEPTATAMTHILLPATEVISIDYRTVTCRFTPETDGIYYIGIHAVSEANMYRLYVDNLRLSAGVLANAPAAVENLIIVNDYDGQNKAVVTFTTPTTCLNGQNLDGLRSATVSRNDKIIKTFDNPQSGTELSFEDNVEAPGLYTYTVLCSNDNGQGEEIEQQAFVGINLPMAPSEFMLTETEPGKVSLSWMPIESTVYGDAVNPGLISYKIVDNSGNVIAENIKGSSYDYVAQQPGQQALMSFSIYASTSAGMNETPAVTDVIPVGTPYDMPYLESCAQWHPWSIVELLGTGSGGYNTWRIMREDMSAGILAYDADDGMLVFMPSRVGDVGSVRTGKIHITANATPYLSFYMYNVAGRDNKLSVVIEAPGMELKEVPVTADWTGWHEVLVPLDEYIGCDVRVCITATATTTEVSTAVDRISVLAIGRHDLAVQRLRVPLEMEYMRDHTVTVDVLNQGLEPVSDYTVDLLCDGNTIASKTGSELARNDNAVISFVVTLDVDTAREYSAVVNFAGDDMPENNRTASVSPDVVMPVYVPVTDLTAVVDKGFARLDWQAPTESGNEIQITETFERYDEFAINFAGEWTFHDRDQGATYGIHNGLHSFPNMTLPMAYIVFNGDIPTIDTIGTMSFGAHSGHQYLATFAVQGGSIANDDWLVSPRLNGKAQSVSFFARSVAIGNHETFEVLYSTTDTAPSSFRKIADGEEGYAEWTEFTYDLPEGTRYFAIRCTSLDRYALFIDDITYIPATSDLSGLKGYDVYRDGQKINGVPLTETSYYDTTAPDGNHRYEVYAVMPRGLSQPAEISIETSAVADVETADVKLSVADCTLVVVSAEPVAVNVFTAAGVNVYSNGSTTDLRLSLEHGVYVVTAGNKTAKVVIR